MSVLVNQTKDIGRISYGYYDGMIPKGCVTIIAGQGSSGKSTLMCYLAEQLCRCAKTVIISNEEPAEIINGRFTNMPPLMIGSFSNNPDNSKITKQDLLGVIKEYDLIFVDSLVTFNEGKDINKAGTAEEFLSPFVSSVANTNKAVVFLHHTNKGGGDTLQDIVSGSERLVSGVRHCKIVINDKLHNRRFLCVAKDNTGLPERNLEIISTKLDFSDGGSTWIISNLVPTTEDMEKVIYENSKAAKIKRWDKKVHNDITSNKIMVHPPVSIQRILLACNGNSINPLYIKTQLGVNEYKYFTDAISKTGDMWVTKTKNGKEVTYHFTDMAINWLKEQA